jgi:hypothetical protein
MAFCYDKARELKFGELAVHGGAQKHTEHPDQDPQHRLLLFRFGVCSLILLAVLFKSYAVSLYFLLFQCS